MIFFRYDIFFIFFNVYYFNKFDIFIGIYFKKINKKMYRCENVVYIYGI